MSDPLALIQQIDNDSLQVGLPPVDDWNPEYCGDSEIRIHRDGSWSHKGEVFKRKKLVEMFSRIIRLDDDGEYYLVTPVEKMKLAVEDVPFIVVGFELVPDSGDGDDDGQKIIFETNMGDKVVVDSDHPISVQTVVEDGRSTGRDDVAPYVIVRKNLKARLARSVFYQLVDLAREDVRGGESVLLLESCGDQFELGRY